MRNLKRNQSKIYYSLAVKDGGTDTNGNSIVTYSEPQPLNISVSAGKGEASMQPYGRDVDYDKEMVTTDKQCFIDENSRLWVGVPPTQPYNYIVKAKLPSLNSVRYAIKRVTTS